MEEKPDKPDEAEVFYELGSRWQAEGRLVEAVDAYRKALVVKPDFAEAWNNLGNVLVNAGELSLARKHYEQALAIDPHDAMYHGNLAAVLFMQAEFDAAIAHYRQALELNPESANVWSNFGNTVSALGRFAEAKDYYERAVALEPAHPIYATNLGSAFYRLGDFENSIAAHRHALELGGDLPQVKLNLGLSLLAAQQFEEGWQLYEERWKTDELAHAARTFAQPQWKGEAEPGRDLFIHFEQGLGDSIQFCRYAPLAAAKGLRVTLEVQEPLVRLLRQSLPEVNVVGPLGETKPVCDYQCAAMSLPLAFQTRWESIPGNVPYLKANAQSVQEWREKIMPLANGKFRVGVVWAGMARSYAAEAAMTDRRRSIPPELLAPLFKNDQVCFFSLQKNGPEAPTSFGMIDLMGECQDFADTAAFVENLNLVISVDTSVAHLAGALGKPVWLLNRFDSCWRWCRSSDATPWYPTMRLFHSPAPGDWPSVIARVTEALEKQSSAQ